ncbi:MAG: ECF transporter S component [Oscillospiraceae bacterium]|nr:ECF transporter S component [Oscillospiraceae bacterium]
MEKRISTRTLAGVALFTALVFALQFMGAAIRFGPFSITLTLIPIVVGAALYGSWAGAWLGFVFSMVVLFTDTAAFMPISPLGTILTVLVKGTAAGFFAGLVYRAFEKKNGWLAAVAAAVTAPVVNTGLFLLGCVLFFLPTITEWGKAAGFENVGAYMVTVFVGLNFLVELAVDLILSPVIVRLIKLGRRENH